MATDTLRTGRGAAGITSKGPMPRDRGLDSTPVLVRDGYLFMSIMNPASGEELDQFFADQWVAGIDSWQRRPAIVLHDEAGQLLCQAVCDWAGVPLPAAEVPRRTRQLRALIEEPAAIGPRYWKGRLTRQMDYRVPQQDLRVSLRQIPTRPASGFVLAGVEAIG